MTNTLRFPRKRVASATAAAFAALVAAATVYPGAASALSARNFFSPGYLGHPVAFCLESSGTCGKPAATAWCKVQGYDEALNFARRANPAEPLRYADTGNICSTGKCIGFRQIKCLRNSG